MITPHLFERAGLRLLSRAISLLSAFNGFNPSGREANLFLLKPGRILYRDLMGQGHMVSCQRSQKKMNLLFHLLNAGLIFYLHLAHGFTAAQVAEKHAWREPMLYS